MTIADLREKCKSLVATVPRDALILGILVLASSLSFGFGYLAGLDVGQTSDVGLQQSPTPEVGAPAGNAGVVASKSGTKYYLPSCAAGGRISDANKVWFASASAASAAGYAPAANCGGL